MLRDIIRLVQPGIERDKLILRDIAEYALTWSHDPRTKNAAVVLSHGDYERGANMFLEESWEAEGDKYTWIEHAERMAIYKAARYGVSLDEGEMYALWAACPDCARAIIASGIRRVVCPVRPVAGEKWAGVIAIADRMLSDARVSVEFIEDVGADWMFSGEMRRI